MSLPIVWTPRATAEVNDAKSWYSDIRPDLATEFVSAIEETIREIAEAPFLFASVRNDLRRAGVRRFPYGLFFIVEPNRVLMIACFHGKRNPQHWISRQRQTF